ncbi:MAG: PDZ domain-containing protein, partial [Boseongicola sp.]|nr:PDZ domain-containing protein [Boseongicola sp.]
LPETAEGLVIQDVAEDSSAFDKGLRIGDLIIEAGQEEISSIAEFEAKIEDTREAGRKTIVILVQRDGDPRFVALPLESG